MKDDIGKEMLLKMFKHADLGCLYIVNAFFINKE